MNIMIMYACDLFFEVVWQDLSLSLMHAVFGQKCCRCGSLRNDGVAGRGKELDAAPFAVKSFVPQMGPCGSRVLEARLS